MGLRSASALLLSALAVWPLTVAEEVEVKAAYLLGFTRFVEWPAPRNANAPVVITVLGDADLHEVLSRMAHGRLVKGRPISVRLVSRAREAEDANILFIPANGLSADTIAGLQGRPVLTVSDSPRFLDRGGMIAFITPDSRVRFSVNQRVVESAGLRCNFQLLRAAREVLR